MKSLETEEEWLDMFKGLIRSYMYFTGIEKNKVYSRVFMENVHEILGKNVVIGETITVLDEKLCAKMEVDVKIDEHVVVAMAGAMVAMMASFDCETALEEASLWLSKMRGREIEEERVLLRYLLCGVSPA